MPQHAGLPMRGPDTVTFGDNGTAQIKFGTSGSGLLELFVKLSRGVNPDVVRADLDALVSEARQVGDAAALADLFVLVFQTRDCRGGKGERLLFRTLFLLLAERFPTEAAVALPLIVEYGYFKDFEQLYNAVGVLKTTDHARYVSLAPLAASAVRVFADQLRRDEATVAAAMAAKVEPDGLSLAAKYAPRILTKGLARRKAVRAAGGDPASAAAAAEAPLDFGRAVRDALFVDTATGQKPGDASARYRRLVSGLNERLGTVEALMSANRWDEIDPRAIPGVCLKRSRKAFLYEDKAGNVRDERDSAANQARVALRRRLLDPKNSQQLHGGQLFANDIVRECMRMVSDGEAAVFDAQWNDIIRTVQRHCDEFSQQQQAQADAAAAAAARGGGGGAAAADAQPEQQPPSRSFDLGNLVPLVDVSGSMAGTPMEVAVAMGLIVSELAAPAFRGRVLTFESVPRWHVVQGATIAQRVRNLMSAPWGTSTNFRAAMTKVVETVEALATRDRRMPAVPELIVFSDMQFDEAGTGAWETAHDTILRDFAALGRRLVRAGVAGVPSPGMSDGSALAPPLITFWNINSHTTGLVAEADTPGVRLLSGFSQSLLKLLLSGALPEPAVQEGAAAAAAGVDPMQTLRSALNDQRYDAVRVVLAGRVAGDFARYKFVPLPKPNDEAAGKGGRGGGNSCG